MTRAWSGSAQAGSREYTEADLQGVLNSLPRGREQAMRLETFCDALTIGARAVRAILADRDGIDFVLAFDDGRGLFWSAEFAEETRHHTEKLRARARTELERVARRERFASTLPLMQETLL